MSYYSWPYSSNYYDDRFWEILMPIFVIVAGIVLLVSFVFYLFNGLGLYKMAKNAGLPNPWLSFVPIANNYLMGKLAERASWYGSGKTLPFAKIFLWGYLGYLAATLLAILLPPLYLFISFAGLALSVFVYIALYYIFKDYSPSNAVLFLILSILFGLYPFFLFALRNRVPVSVAGFCPGGQPKYQPYGGGQPPQPGSGGYTGYSGGPTAPYQPPYAPYGGPGYYGAPAPRPFADPAPCTPPQAAPKAGYAAPEDAAQTPPAGEGSFAAPASPQPPWPGVPQEPNQPAEGLGDATLEGSGETSEGKADMPPSDPTEKP